jgi:hypothetical protein
MDISRTGFAGFDRRGAHCLSMLEGALQFFDGLPGWGMGFVDGFDDTVIRHGVAFLF